MFGNVRIKSLLFNYLETCKTYRHDVVNMKCALHFCIQRLFEICFAMISILWVTHKLGNKMHAHYFCPVLTETKICWHISAKLISIQYQTDGQSEVAEVIRTLQGVDCTCRKDRTFYCPLSVTTLSSFCNLKFTQWWVWKVPSNRIRHRVIW
jgi:hypothetical protein